MKRATTTCVTVTPGDVKNVTSLTEHRLLNVATQVFCNTWCTGACGVWEHAMYGSMLDSGFMLRCLNI